MLSISSEINKERCDLIPWRVVSWTLICLTSVTLWCGALWRVSSTVSAVAKVTGPWLKKALSDHSNQTVIDLVSRLLTSSWEELPVWDSCKSVYLMHIPTFGNIWKKNCQYGRAFTQIVPDCSSGVLSRSEQRTSGIGVTCKTNFCLPSVVDHLTVKHKTCDISHLRPPSFEYIKLRRLGVMLASCGQIGLKHVSWRYTFNIRKRLKVKVVVTVDLNKEAY